jgi:hypothetical protein
VWWDTPVLPVLGRPKQEDGETNADYIVSSRPAWMMNEHLEIEREREREREREWANTEKIWTQPTGAQGVTFSGTHFKQLRLLCQESKNWKLWQKTGNY